MQAHEGHILQLSEMVKSFPDIITNEDVVNTISNARSAVNLSDHSKYLSAFVDFTKILEDLQFRHKWEQFQQSKSKNLQFVFITVYTRMVKRLLEFIEASQTRNWLQHLSSAEALMQGFIAMDHCKYRKGWMTYIADMKHLQTSDPDVWQYFMDGNFSVQKSDIPGVAIGCGHAGEQVNCEDKSRGGLKGITRNENSRVRNYLVKPTLGQISEQLLTQAHTTRSTGKNHHQLSKSYKDRQSTRVLTLLQVLQQHELGLDLDECKSIRNMATDQIFSEEVSRQVCSCEHIGSKIYDEQVKERLQPDST